MKLAVSILAAAALSAAALLPAFASATEAAPPANADKGLALELNRVAPGSAGCLLTFVIRNDTGGAIDAARYEVVLFNKAGLVEQLTTLDFGALAPAKTVVRQFDLPGLSCPDLGRLLVNGPAGCTGDSGNNGDGPAAPLCTAPLHLSSRTDISVLN